jgi:chromatin modification-related protein EAF6
MATVSQEANALTSTYYEKIKKELKDLIAKKRTVDKSLSALEDTIFKYEGSYLEDTQNGNIIRGFDNYLKAPINRRRGAVSDNDRIFSLSSASYLRAMQRESSPGADSDDARSQTRKKKRCKDDTSSGSDADTSKRPRISFRESARDSARET